MHSELFHGSHTVWCKSATMLSNVHLRQVASAFRNHLWLSTPVLSWTGYLRCHQNECVCNKNQLALKRLVGFALWDSRLKRRRKWIHCCFILKAFLDRESFAANCGSGGKLLKLRSRQKIREHEKFCAICTQIGNDKATNPPKISAKPQMLSCCWFQLFEAFDWLYQT